MNSFKVINRCMESYTTYGIIHRLYNDYKYMTAKKRVFLTKNIIYNTYICLIIKLIVNKNDCICILYLKTNVRHMYKDISNINPIPWMYAERPRVFMNICIIHKHTRFICTCNFI